MSKLQQHDEFYIGYQPKAPGKTSKVITRTVILLGVIMVVICALIAVSQRKFSTGVFEYGKLTTMEGVLSFDPVPNLRIRDGNRQSMVLLVGFGKMGIEKVFRSLEARGNKLENHYIHLRGTRIHDHGKEILQVTLEDNIDVTGKRIPENFPALKTEQLGSFSLTGEIVDPKCYFGVMKPAEGKPHRSCAIRCIAGGIFPVFVVKNSTIDFVILNGENINTEILPLVGDPLQLKGDLIKIDNWIMMNVDMDNIKLLATSRTKGNLQMLDEGVTLCISSLD